MAFFVGQLFIRNADIPFFLFVFIFWIHGVWGEETVIINECTLKTVFYNKWLRELGRFSWRIE